LEKKIIAATTAQRVNAWESCGLWLHQAATTPEDGSTLPSLYYGAHSYQLFRENVLQSQHHFPIIYSDLTFLDISKLFFLKLPYIL